MQSFQLLVARDGRATGGDAVYHDAVGKQDFQHVAIAGIAAEFTTVADHEYYFAPALLALAQIHSSHQDRIVEYVRSLRRRDGCRDAAIIWNVIDGRALGT